MMFSTRLTPGAEWKTGMQTAAPDQQPVNYTRFRLPKDEYRFLKLKATRLSIAHATDNATGRSLEGASRNSNRRRPAPPRTSSAPDASRTSPSNYFLRDD
jgi:hypothetical protein